MAGSGTVENAPAASEVSTHEQTQANLRNELESVRSILVIAREAGRDAGTVPMHEAREAEITAELARSVSAHDPLATRLRDKERECQSLARSGS